MQKYLLCYTCLEMTVDLEKSEDSKGKWSAEVEILQW